jgi:hypothetical protein
MEWRQQPGPLYVMGLDVGAGPVKVRGEYGVLIAIVQSNSEVPEVTMESSQGKTMHKDTHVMN